MNEYEQRQEARRERYLERAAKADRMAGAASQAAHEMGSAIPCGQPILVGHHSEKRHRRDLERIDNKHRRSFELTKTAAYYRGKADGVGRAGISADDPEALDKLRRKVAGLEVLRDWMKRVNAAWRKAKKPSIAPENRETWREIQNAAGVTNSQLVDIMYRIQVCPYDPMPFPGYALTNLGGRIKSAQRRIGELEQREKVRETIAAEGGELVQEREEAGVTVIEDHEENRIRLVFPGKPEAGVRSLLKSRGFRWSRYAGAWQRQLNNAGRYAASYVLDQLREKEAAHAE